MGKPGGASLRTHGGISGGNMAKMLRLWGYLGVNLRNRVDGNYIIGILLSACRLVEMLALARHTSPPASLLARTRQFHHDDDNTPTGLGSNHGCFVGRYLMFRLFERWRHTLHISPGSTSPPRKGRGDGHPLQIRRHVRHRGLVQSSRLAPHPRRHTGRVRSGPTVHLERHRCGMQNGSD